MVRKFKKKYQNIKAVEVQGLLSLRERKKESGYELKCIANSVPVTSTFP